MAQSASTQNDYIEQIVSPTHQRNPFLRQKSWINPSSRYQHVAPEDQDIAEYEETGPEHEQTEAYGLGLRNVPSSSTVSIVKRKPVTLATSPEPPVGNGSENLSQASTVQNSANIGVVHNSGVKWATASATPQSSRYSLQEAPYKHVPDDVRLISHEQPAPTGGCPTDGDLLKPEWTWFTILILVLAVFSWVFSAIILGIGVSRPRWGHRIGTGGSLSYDAATLLSALISKLVELSFCTTFVATLGQILTRRAFATTKNAPGNQGISLAEMNMRLWIMQPGTLLTHWTGARYVLTSLLGIVALAAAFSATFYTTAAEALVSPKLKFGDNQTLRLYGQVSASYGNANWAARSCDTPVSLGNDADKGATCLQVDLAGNGYRNLKSWLTVWKEMQEAPVNMVQAGTRPRPPPSAVLYDNTTVHGKWIRPSKENITADSMKHNRYVHNATIVMPHNNVYHAARYPKNRQILQPNDLQGAGAYYLKAAVPAPGINALCVGLSEQELAPMIGNGNQSSIPAGWPNISTPIDSLFNWSKTPNIDLGTYHHPWFAKLPISFNTIANTTFAYGNPSNYFIAKPPPTVVTQDYVLCGIRSFQFSNCSTSLFVASAGSELSVHCDTETTIDPQTWKTYSKTIMKNETELPMVVSSPDYGRISSEWVRAIGLTSGIHGGNSSAERLLTQLIPPYSNTTAMKLDPSFPSLPEALCVLASYTLLLGSTDAPFVHYWDYAYSEQNILTQPAEVDFLAILSYKDYSSGGDQKWKGIFYIILAAVFALNSFCLMCLLYYFVRYGEVTDYTEPQNLFALAINSPPSQMLAGSCGGGPSSEMLGRKWCVDMSMPARSGDEFSGSATGVDPGHGPGHGHGHTEGAPHFFVRYPEEEPLLASAATTPATNTNRFSAMFSPRSPQVIRRSKRSSMVRPDSEYEMEESPAVAQYMKLIGR